MNKVEIFLCHLKSEWELRDIPPCPPCPHCGHKHRLGKCVCGCLNGEWREYPVSQKLHWTIRYPLYWIYDALYGYKINP